MKPKPEATAGDVRLAAMDLLARREHSALELQRKLLERGYPAGLVEDALQGLAADGLQSDARFTETFVYSRIQRGSGPAKIRAELRMRGIADSLIRDGLDDCAEDWLERLREVRERKFGAALPMDLRERGRQVRFLQQRGFAPEQIARVLREQDD